MAPRALTAPRQPTGVGRYRVTTNALGVLAVVVALTGALTALPPAQCARLLQDQTTQVPPAEPAAGETVPQELQGAASGAGAASALPRQLYCNSTGTCDPCPSVHNGDSTCAAGYREPVECTLAESWDGPYQVIRKAPNDGTVTELGQKVQTYSTCTPMSSSASVIVFEIVVSGLLVAAFPVMLWRKRAARRPTTT